MHNINFFEGDRNGQSKLKVAYISWYYIFMKEIIIRREDTNIKAQHKSKQIILEEIIY